MTQLEQQGITEARGKVIYTAKIHTNGGRENGAAHSSDGRLDVKLSVPGSTHAGTNPEQLFAAGWSACFESAIMHAARKRKISTPELNRWLETVDLGRGTTPKSRPVRIYYITQAKTAPPTFLLFTNQRTQMHFSFERFLENQLRKKFDLTGAPIRFVQRLRKRDRDTRPSGRDDK